MRIVFKKDPNEGVNSKDKVASKLNLSLDAKLKNKIVQIQLLVGVTHADFNFLYVGMIQKLAVSYEPLLDEILKIVIKALRRRRGYLLPIGSDSEVSFREHEVWTYAVFTAAILKFILLNVPDQSLKSIKPIVSLAGLLWLERYPDLIEQWNAYLLDTQETIFAELINFPLKEVHESSSLSSVSVD